MELQKLAHTFAVCKICDIRQIDCTREFVFLSKTDEELSLVCESDHIPPDAIETELGWSALRIKGILDFGMTGVLAKVASILAEAEISIFAVSTYNTDYIFIKSVSIDKAMEALRDKGYVII